MEKKNTRRWMFIFRHGAISYKRLRLVTRQGKNFYRDEMGCEVPERFVSEKLSTAQQEKFVSQYNERLLLDYHFRMAKYPEEEGSYPFRAMTYDEIINYIKHDDA